jgi:hypothetical protein
MEANRRQKLGVDLVGIRYVERLPSKWAVSIQIIASLAFTSSEPFLVCSKGAPKKFPQIRPTANINQEEGPSFDLSSQNT